MERELHERDEHNVVRLTLGKTPAGGRKRAVYARCAALFQQWRNEGVLVQDSVPCIYIVQQAFRLRGQDFTRTGFIAAVLLEELGKGSIFPHERTFGAPRTDRLRMAAACHANLSQILGACSDPDGELDRFVCALCEGVPLLCFQDDDGVGYMVWSVSDPDAVARLQELLSERVLVIADGHHRYESALHYSQVTRRPDASPGAAPQDYLPVLCISVANPGLRVLPTHRRATSPGRFVEEQAVRALRRTFEIAPVAVRGADHLQKDFESAQGTDACIGCYLPRGRLLILHPRDRDALRARFPEEARTSCDLPVSILHQVVIPDVLGVAPGSPEEAKHVDYRREAQQVYWGVESGQFHLGFLLPPTEASTVERVASLGQRLPQKSTYFYPKIASGLVFYAHEPHTLP